MVKPRVLVLTGEGINCDLETLEAFEKAFESTSALAERVHVNDLIEGYKRLGGYQILALPGGFSFADDIASGKVLAVKMKTKLGDEIYEFISNGNLVIGICNGAQIGVKYPIPGLSADDQQTTTLTYNDSGRFQCEWIKLKRTGDRCIWTRDMDALELPIAHGEGKFYVSDRKVLNELYKNEQVVLKYDGYNPNGSIDDIAGVCDPSGRIFVLMPHPERYIHPYQHPQWTRQKIEGRLPKEGAGLQIFRNGVNYFA